MTRRGESKEVMELESQEFRCSKRDAYLQTEVKLK